MPSVGHIAVGLAAGRAWHRGPGWGRAGLALAAVSAWPDVDVLGFALGVPYGAPFGHRGATHSLAAAAVVGLLGGLWARGRRLAVGRVAALTFAVAASHGLLDCLTYGGGLGCALLWPLSDDRYWGPVRFIPVAPIGLAMLSARGLEVALAEVVVFAPCWLYALWPRRARAG